MSGGIAMKPITIFGQMVIDHVVHVRHPHEAANLRRAMKWDDMGNVEFLPDAYISTPYVIGPKAHHLVFKLPPGRYIAGDKIAAGAVVTKDMPPNSIVVFSSSSAILNSRIVSLASLQFLVATFATLILFFLFQVYKAEYSLFSF